MSVSATARPIALVTGASSGIGLELARRFAAGGYDLVLVARRREPLESLARELEPRGSRSDVVVEDLEESDAPARIEEMVHRLGREVDVLVNSAGFGLIGSYLATDGEREAAMIRLNAGALTDLTKRFLPGMVARRRGGVLNVASTAAFQPGPGMAVYYATKAYVLSYTEALHWEVRGAGVTVTALCPGPTVTKFQDVAGLHGSRLLRAVRQMDAVSVARAGYEGFHSRKRVVIPGAINTLLAYGARLLPSGVSARLAQRLHTREH